MNWAESTRDTRVDNPHHTPEPRAVQDRQGIHSGCHCTLILLAIEAQTVTGGVRKVTRRKKGAIYGQVGATT